MAVPIEALFRMNAWSTERLIETCEALTPQQLDADAPNTAGTIRNTLAHIVEAEQTYITRLGGTPAEPRLKYDDRPDLDTLRRMAHEHGEILASMAAAAPPDWQVQGTTEYGVTFDAQAIVFMLQAANHGASHRQQVVSLLSGLGLAPPNFDEEIDPWSWGVATGALRTN